MAILYSDKLGTIYVTIVTKALGERIPPARRTRSKSRVRIQISDPAGLRMRTSILNDFQNLTGTSMSRDVLLVQFKRLEDTLVCVGLRRMVTVAFFCAVYKYSYLLTYLLTSVANFLAKIRLLLLCEVAKNRQIDKQTDKQTDKLRAIHNLRGGGNDDHKIITRQRVSDGCELTSRWMNVVA